MFTQGGSSVLFGRIRQQNFVGRRRNSQQLPYSRKDKQSYGNLSASEQKRQARLERREQFDAHCRQAGNKKKNRRRAIILNCLVWQL